MQGKIHKSVSITGKILLIFFFLIAVTMVIMSASGYRLEVTNKEFVRTAMIAVKALPRNAVLTVNSKVYEPDNLWRVPNLNPGEYSLEVSKPAYHTWSHTVKIDAGQTAIFEDVVLFLLKPTENLIENNAEKAKLISDLNNQRTDTNIIVEKNEITFDGELVTRYSEDIYNAKLYADEAHVTFIAGDQFHVIDIDGSNDMALFSLKNDSKYLLLNGGQTVLCLEGDKLRQVRIR